MNDILKNYLQKFSAFSTTHNHQNQAFYEANSPYKLPQIAHYPNIGQIQPLNAQAPSIIKRQDAAVVARG